MDYIKRRIEARNNVIAKLGICFPDTLERDDAAAFVDAVIELMGALQPPAPNPFVGQPPMEE